MADPEGFAGMGWSEGTAVTKAGAVYAIGGRGPGGVLADIDRYRPATDTWVSLPDMPTPRAGLAAAVVGRAIYVIGGRDSVGGPCSQAPGGELATVERFDIPTRTWTTVARLPSARSDLGAIAHGGKIYVFGGCRVKRNFSITFLNDVDVYNPRSNRWSTAPADLPTARAAMYGMGRRGGRIYVIGGWSGGGPLDTNEVYKVAANAWSKAASMLTARAEMGVASRGGRIYTVGGALPAFGASSNANEVFKPQ
jgi:N-acetylneuraminic acid mutarotase